MKKPFSKWITARNTAMGLLYRFLLKPLLFRCDPEWTHDQFTKIGAHLGAHEFSRKWTRYIYGIERPELHRNILGIPFPNPIGLAAGFDKDAHLLSILPELGFGFVEIGSITGSPCNGNPKPRLWRHPEEKALRVNYGLKNQGAEILAKKLRYKKFKIPYGTSIAKTNCLDTVDTEAAIADYAKSFEIFAAIGDYFTLNISCPNAFGGQPFTDAHRLEKLLARLDLIPSSKPIFIKLSPDLEESSLDSLLTCISRHRVHGLISTNLTKKHNKGLGGLSGKALANQAKNQLSLLREKTSSSLVLVSCGGIFSAEDTRERLEGGAALIQVVTGMIYEGPQLISSIQNEL